MNVARFFDHWGLKENPFSAEEARHDGVFARLAPDTAAHPDFEKILGDLARPATSIVFGEKGSGKTAIRMQIEQRVAAWNEKNPDKSVLLIAFDDLNPALDRFVARQRAEGAGGTAEALASWRLADVMDAILHAATAPLVDSLLSRDAVTRARLKKIRRSAPMTRADIVLLQAVYDRPLEAPARTRRLRRLLAAPGDRSRDAWSVAAALGWIPPTLLGAWLYFQQAVPLDVPVWTFGVGSLAAAWALALIARFILTPWLGARFGRRVARRVRVIERSASSFARSLAALPRGWRALAPMAPSEDSRFEMFDRLREAARSVGFSNVIIVVDRIDEPTLVSGDPDRMRSIVWPMMSSKFLQMDSVGLKLLLPIELRHLLFRESSVFFQEARLDKQNLIENLSWTGATLYDLCTARMRACRVQDNRPLTLGDLFDEDVRKQDVIDALEQMRQPRDAFKLIYQCIQERCATVTEDQAEADGAWRIPRLILETVRRRQADRVLQLTRGMSPA